MSTTPEGFVIERCRTETCNAEIVWARTNTGKLMPVDAEPSGVGNVRLYERQGIVRAEVAVPPKHCPKCGEPTGYINGQSFCERCGWQDDPAQKSLRTSHFMTCQRPADWRKPR